MILVSFREAESQLQRSAACKRKASVVSNRNVKKPRTSNDDFNRSLAETDKGWLSTFAEISISNL